MLEFDATIFIAMISFAIFMILMNIVLYEPMRKIVEKRKSLLALNDDEIECNKSTTSSLIEEKDCKLNDARVDMRGIISDITDEAKKKKAEVINNANASAVQQLDNAKKDLDDEVKVVKSELKDDVINLAQSILGKVTGQEIAISGVPPEKLDEVLNNGV